MLFNSYLFVFAFFPLCLLGMRVVKGKRRTAEGKVLLVLLSLLFYGFSQPLNIPVLLFSMAVNYGVYRKMEKRNGGKKKGLLAVGLVFNVLLLFGFKYTGAVFVPLGISFFTFEQIAFLMEGYRGNLKRISALDYSVFISFFPKIMQGPIMLPEEMLRQTEAAFQKPFDGERFFRGLSLFVLGLSKKVLLADTFGRAADFGYQNLGALNTADGLVVMLSYALQLYFDFSGYSEMAMGISEMLGFTLPLNFNSPYKASNIIEFWKGWHITLTRFFTRYLYIPLGGSRKGRMRTYVNTLIIFLVSGIWHGAGITFVIWGMLHGVLYVITRWLQERKPVTKEKKRRPGALHAGKVFLTFLYVNVAWVFFRAPSVGDAVSLLKTICSFEFGRMNWDLAGCFNLDELWYVIKVLGIDSWSYAHYIWMALLLLAALFLVFFGKTAVTAAERLRPTVPCAAGLAILFVWCVTSFSEVSSFLYLNF